MKSKVTSFIQNKFAVGAVGIGLLAGMMLLFPHVANDEGRINMLLGLVVVVCLVAGSSLLLYSFSSSGGSGGVLAMGRKAKKYAASHPPNTILLIGRKDAKGQNVPVSVKFLYSPKKWGIEHKLTNTGQYFYLAIYDIDLKKIVPVMLPDTVYLDPRSCRIPLAMKADEDYWRPVPTMWQKVAPFAIVVVILIEWLMALTLGGD